MQPQSLEHSIFLEEKASSTLHDQENKPEEPLPSDSIPYLKKGDSNIYVDQFLAKEEPELRIEEPLMLPQPAPKVEKKEENYSEEPDESFTVSDGSKFNPSAFHNFQKHLTVCIKNAIHITADPGCPDYVALGIRLWRTFQASSVSTKKVLHYLLGEKNEHKITEQGLKECHLLKIYEAHDEETLRQARIFLGNECLRQIKSGRLNDYINAKKLKSKDKFRKYVGIFAE